MYLTREEEPYLQRPNCFDNMTIRRVTTITIITAVSTTSVVSPILSITLLGSDSLRLSGKYNSDSLIGDIMLDCLYVLGYIQALTHTH